MSAPSVRIHVAANNVGSFVEVDGVRLPGVLSVRTRARVGQIPVVVVEVWANPLDLTIDDPTVMRVGRRKPKRAP
jgi:hypothetical protein